MGRKCLKFSVTNKFGYNKMGINRLEVGKTESRKDRKSERQKVGKTES